MSIDLNCNSGQRRASNPGRAYHTPPAIVVCPGGVYTHPARDECLDLTCCARAASVNTAPPAKSSAQKAETEVVVAIARRIPVAIRRPAVDGVVVPTAAPIHPVRAVFGIQPKLKNFRPVQSA
jgi:hypothetical protein